MRAKLILMSAVCLLVLAQVIYSLTKGRVASPAATAAPAAATASATMEAPDISPSPVASDAPIASPGPDLAAAATAAPSAPPETDVRPGAAVTESGPANAPEPAILETPAPASLAAGDIAAIVIQMPDENEPIRLERQAGSWTVTGAGLPAVLPADSGRVAALLNKLLAGERKAISPEEEAPAGLAPGQGISLSLLKADGGQALVLTLGLRPTGDYAAVFARDDTAGKGEAFLLAEDIRGDLGLWRNLPDARPDSLVWLKPHLLEFFPDQVSAVSLESGELSLGLERIKDGVWRRRNGETLEETRESEELTAWLADLARLRLVGVAASGPEAAQPELSLALELADGASLSLAIFHDRDNDIWLALKDGGGPFFQLPAWRLERGFRLLLEMANPADTVKPGEPANG
ncbi:MAG: hypothetical protein LBV15_05255 [Planctomycetota bacterium]|jgi:hypothetical protein|nr:hypothetical protein [Planctomycetota bacterium]